MGQDILVVAEHLKGSIDDVTYELLGKGKELSSATGGSLSAVLLGGSADMAGSLGAAANVYHVDHAQLAEFNPEAYVTALCEVVEQKSPGLVLVPNTSMGMDLAAALSARKNLALVAYAIDVKIDDGKVVATSQLYAGKIYAESVIDGDTGIVSVLAGSFPADAGKADGAPNVEAIAAPAALDDTRVQFTGLIEPEGGDVDITQHDVLVAVGRGIQSEEESTDGRRARRQTRRRGVFVPADRRQQVAAEDSPSRQIRSQGEAKDLSDAGHQRCTRALGRHEGRRTHRRVQHRRDGTDL